MANARREANAPAKADAVRVAIDVTATLGRRSGIGHLVAELLQAIHDQTTDATDDATSGSEATTELVPFAVTFRGRHAAATHQRWPMPARPLRALWKRANFPPIEWWTGPIDVVHGTNFVVPPTRRAAALVSVHDLTPVRFPELCTPDTLQYPALICRAVARGAHVHTDSQFVADEVCEWLRLDADRVHVIRPGIPGPDPRPDDLAARSPSPPAGKPYVLALGTVEPRKNIPLLVRSFGRLARTFPEVQLVIAGADAWGGPDVTAAIAALPSATSERVVRVGYVDDRMRAELLAGAAVFAYPSRYEGFGFPPLEAMRAGVPVVSTTAGSLPEVLGDAALLVEPDDEDAFTHALTQVLRDVGLAGCLRRRGTVRAQITSWPSCARAMTALYRTLAGRQF